jgi:putative ABC transport system permease protein
MKWIDILRTSLSNLLRRKLRSVLTMLGVVLGTAAIVVTMSLGEGAERTQMAALEASTNLKLIQVWPNYGGGGDGESGSIRKISKITDSVIREIRAVDHVDAVTPLVYVWGGMSFSLETGKYKNEYTTLVGVIPEDFKKLVDLKDGTFFSGSTDRMEFLMPEMTMMEFRDPKKKNQEYVDVWQLMMDGKELPLPDINWLRDKYTLIMRWEDYSNVSESKPDPEVYTKEFKAKMMGIIDADLSSNFNSGAFVNLNWLKRLKKENKALFKELNFTGLDSYDQVYVLAESVDDVVQVVRDLTKMGVQCYSPMESVATFKEQIATMQAFLGFIGMISMLVAALSIANTMMMSIYERTREIGVMKVLGCKLSNIRMMFLSEAAYIGIFGGALGLMASYGLSYALNNVPWLQQIVASVMSGSNFFGGGMGDISVITPQLALLTWLGVIVVSVASGFYPAQRAMKLSSLAAIRNND